MGNIKKACLLISRSNGGINRFRSEAQARRQMQKFLDGRNYQDLFPQIDAWLGTLTPEQFETVCDGEMSEADAILKNAPAFTEALLADYFEEVC